jgi:Family of unknown function (DUF6459)
VKSISLRELNPKELWHHPVLPIFIEEQPTFSPEIPTKLYLVPTLDNLDGETLDPDFLPQPSPLSDLPEISNWVKRYVVGVVEIWGGKRPAFQLARWSHRKVFKQLTSPSPISEGAKIRKIYISQPIEGVIEATTTLLISKRVRSLSLRFEGVDKRWLCTELLLI